MSMDMAQEAVRNMAGTVLGAAVGVCLRPQRGGGGGLRQGAATQGPRDAAKNVGELRRGRGQCPWYTLECPILF